jgi:hypothetical protein
MNQPKNQRGAGMITIDFTYEELGAPITELEQPTTRPYDATIAEIVDPLEQKKKWLLGAAEANRGNARGRATAR